MDTNNFYITIVTAILGSNVINGLLSHILYNKKLKKELKSKGNDMIASKIQESLHAFRSLELKLSNIEIYDAEERLKDNNVNFFGGEAIYLEIFNNWTSYNTFMDAIRTCRQSYEHYLSCKVALHLVFIDRYIMQLSKFMSNFQDECLLPVFGTVFIFDLQSWQKKIDRILVKELNKYNLKLESHQTRKWQLLRKKIIEKQWKDTILYAILYDDYHKYKKETIDEIKTMWMDVIIMKNN